MGSRGSEGTGRRKERTGLQNITPKETKRTSAQVSPGTLLRSCWGQMAPPLQAESWFSGKRCSSACSGSPISEVAQNGLGGGLGGLGGLGGAGGLGLTHRCNRRAARERERGPWRAPTLNHHKRRARIPQHTPTYLTHSSGREPTRPPPPASSGGRPREGPQTPLIFSLHLVLLAGVSPPAAASPVRRRGGGVRARSRPRPNGGHRAAPRRQCRR